MDIIYIPGSKPEKLLPKQDGTYTLRELQDLVYGIAILTDKIN